MSALENISRMGSDMLENCSTTFGKCNIVGGVVLRGGRDFIIRKQSSENVLSLVGDGKQEPR